MSRAAGAPAGPRREPHPRARHGSDGSVLAATNNGVLVALDPATGALRWRFDARSPHGSDLSTSPAVVSGGTIRRPRPAKTLFALDAKGHPLWRESFAGAVLSPDGAGGGRDTYSSAMATPRGKSCFGDDTGRVRVVDTATGTVERTLTPLGAGTEKVWTSVVVDARGSCFWATTEGNVHGYREDRTRLFQSATGSPIDGYPALGADGSLCVGTTGGTLHAIR